MQGKNFCSKCGNKLDIGDDFCENCGKPIKKINNDIDNEYDIELSIKNINIYGEPSGYTKIDIEIPTIGKVVTVNVPNYINTDGKLKLRGLGHEKPDGTKGDVYLVFEKINYHYDKEDFNKTELKSLRCPSCGAILDYDEEEIDIYHCKYCKSTIYFNGISKEAYRSKTKIKSMKHDEIMVDKKHQHDKEMIDKKYIYEKDKYARKFKMKVIKGILIGVGCFLVFLLVYILPFSIMKKESIEEEKELQLLVDEIMLHVENEEFNEAYLKAKKIVYTEGWSSEIEEKWDETRRETINYIIKEEKRVTGKSEHKPEKEGLFESLFK